MLSCLPEIKNSFCQHIHSQLFTNDDIAFTENQKGLVFTYPNIKFLEATKNDIKIKKELIDAFPEFQTYVNNSDYKKATSPANFVKIIFENAFLFEFYARATEIFLYYISKKDVTSFGCCSHFNECSDKMKCIKTDKSLYLGCYYRKNLEQGHIYYGKNKNC